jgi:hypothetical protein
MTRKNKSRQATTQDESEINDQILITDSSQITEFTHSKDEHQIPIQTQTSTQTLPTEQGETQAQAQTQTQENEIDENTFIEQLSHLLKRCIYYHNKMIRVSDKNVKKLKGESISDDEDNQVPNEGSVEGSNEESIEGSNEESIEGSNEGSNVETNEGSNVEANDEKYDETSDPNTKESESMVEELFENLMGPADEDVDETLAGLILNEEARENILKFINRAADIVESIETRKIDAMRTIMRFNTYMKIDNEQTPVDPLRHKISKSFLLSCLPLSPIDNLDMQGFLNYARSVGLSVMPLSDIPLVFLINCGKYMELHWNYILSLYYFSQILLVIAKEKEKEKKGGELTEEEVKHKEIRVQIMNDSINKLIVVLDRIDEIEEKSAINRLVESDEFMINRFNKSGMIDEGDMGDGVNKFKETLGEYLDEDDKGAKFINKIIDKVQKEVKGGQLKKGKGFKGFIKIAKSIANDMKSELANDKDALKNIIASTSKVFTNLTKDGGKKLGFNLPPQVMSLLTNMSKLNFDQTTPSTTASTDATPDLEEDPNQMLEELMKSSGLNPEDFYKNISTGGTIDYTKLQKFITGMGGNGGNKQMQKALKKMKKGAKK